MRKNAGLACRAGSNFFPNEHFPLEHVYMSMENHFDKGSLPAEWPVAGYELGMFIVDVGRQSPQLTLV